jgi:hypothetical protein
MSFVPKLATLPEAQRAIWNELKQVPRRFVLYGGTALALRLGHRQSEDFDFFADAPVLPEELLHGLPLLKDAVIRQNAPNTLTVVVGGGSPVKLSFFGLRRRRVNNPEATDDGVVRVASLLDIAAFKMAVLPARAEAKDYLDVHALLQNGVALSDALGAAQAVYGEQFNPILTLKALTYFSDGNLPTLPKHVQQALRAAAVVKRISYFEPLPGGLVPLEI